MCGDHGDPAQSWGHNDVAPMSSDHRAQLVFQFRADSVSDFDDLIQLESMLREGLDPRGHHLVEGHDFGSGSANIFVHSALPAEAFAVAEQIIRKEQGNEWAAAGRTFEQPESPWILLWPDDLTSFDLMGTHTRSQGAPTPRARPGARVRTSVQRAFLQPGRGLVRLLALDLDQGEEDFFIVDAGQDQFAQALRLDPEVGGGFLVEHRDGGPDSHFGFTADSRAEMADALSDWLFQATDWKSRYPWKPVSR